MTSLTPRIVLVAATVAAAFAPAPTGAVAAERCDALTGKVALKTPKIKVVARRVDDRLLRGTRLLGCARPSGKVFTVAERGTPKGQNGVYNSVAYALGDHAGRFLAVRRFYGDGIAQIQDIHHAIMNLATGANRKYFRGAWGENVCEGDEGLAADTPPVRRLLLKPTGSFAVLYANGDPEMDDCFPADGEAVLVGFAPGRKRATLDRAPLDDIAPASLTLSGTTFGWTNAGRDRSETL